MQTYVILARFSPRAYSHPKDIHDLAKKVRERIKNECRNLEWVGSYATFGRYDVVDIVEASDEAEVRRAAMLINSVGHCTTETLVGTRWKDFLAKI